jgi:ribonuclease HI
MERMINNRLAWYLEKQKIITPMQSGFRKQRSTTDQLLRLETFVREAFIQRQHAVAVFFDLEKAYDMTWKYGIMKDLSDAGLHGRLPMFIESFLQDRQFQVRLGSFVSQQYDQETGLPQGSILSVILFALKINSIVKTLSPGIECSLYVDDFVICYRSKHIHIIERHIQGCLNKLQDWADTNGFKFSTSKTVCMHFCRLRKTHCEPNLTLNGNLIPLVEETKFLGLIFDRKLSFLPHIKYLKDKCVKALNLLRVVSHTAWGADQETLLHLYRSLIRSKLDYGCVVYGSARSSYLKALDPVQNHGLRLCLGAFRTSPSASLCVEANEPPPFLRRKKLALQYCLKLSANPRNPAYNAIFLPKFKVQFEKKPTQIPPLGIRLSSDLHTIGLRRKNVSLYTIPVTPPWLLTRPTIDFSLHSSGKSDTSPEIFRSRFSELCDRYKHYYRIFTDGSKMGVSVAAAAVCKNSTRSVRLSDKASIFSAEMYALTIAINIVRRTNKINFIIFSDSMSSLQALNSCKVEIDLVQKFMKEYTLLTKNGKSIILCWITSHIGISGNEREIGRAHV